jgi:hypothetical protein
MLKRNTFLIISLLVVMALVFGTSAKVDAKAWPNCPFSTEFKIRGPAIILKMDFVKVDSREDAIFYNGQCGNVTIDEPITWEDVEWSEGSGTLTEEDLEGAVFGVDVPPDIYIGEGTPPELWELLQACYPDDVDIYCLKVQNVRNFTEENGEYSADVILLRAVPPNK